MTIRKTIEEKGWNIECNEMSCYRAMIVHVGFIDANGNDDETSFDIAAYDVKELDTLYSDFCKENGLKRNTVTSISVVAVAESMEKLQNIDM